MRFNKKWIDTWVPNTLSADELSDMITMAGLEVDTVSPVCGEFDKVVVGKVVECFNHPDSDHLHVTKVDAGTGELLQIVCGAPNCREGLKVAVSLVGAKLPGITIKAAKLRGVDSCGMLCSYAELGMAEESDGIIELPEDAPIGMDVHEYMQLDDSAIEVDLTTNRPDCLGIRGLAREVGVLLNTDVHEPDFKNVPATCEDIFPVEVEAPEACPRYLCRIIHGVNQKAKSPLWMTERLRRCGIRSVSPIVDVTNYVMLELCQPLHSFDLNNLNEKIIVRMAKEGEKLTLLSGDEVALKPDTLVIADAKGPVALAGIFGGLNSGINDATTDVLLEAAFFSRVAIKGRAREYGLNTDASHRYERGVDPIVQHLALERATDLLLQIAGGTAGPIHGVEHEDLLPVYNPIALRRDRLAKVLGKRIDDDEVFNILSRLDLNPTKTADGFTATSPSFRFDIAIEEDLIEEVARIHGYNNIENRLPVSDLYMTHEAEHVVKDRRIRDVMTDNGYLEAITYSFTDPKVLSVFDDTHPLMLTSPISSEMSAMRTTLLASLAVVAKYNVNRQQKRVRLFENGLRYIIDKDAENGVRQEAMLAGICVGDNDDELWNIKSRPVDFFDVKGTVEAVLSLTADPKSFKWVRTQCKFLHPGQGADLYLNGRKVGVVGMLHPLAQKALGFKQPVGVFEIEKSAIVSRKIPLYAPISKFPSVRRDFAFVLNKDVEAVAVVDLIKGISPIIKEVRVFDVFEDASLGDKRSLALGVIFQDPDRTLEDSVVEDLANKIVAGVKNDFDGDLRA